LVLGGLVVGGGGSTIQSNTLCHTGIISCNGLFVYKSYGF
jgi:hypothetical protein